MTSERRLTEQGVEAVAAAVWDAAATVQAGARPSWAAAVADPVFAAGVAVCRQEARTAFDAAAAFVESNLTMEFRRENHGPSQGWRPVRRWEDIDALLVEGVAVQQRPVGAWMYLDDGTNGKGVGDARLAFS